MSYWGGYGGWAPRKTAAQRRAEAARAVAKAARAGKPMSPVVIDGRKIARTFWGMSWCDNLERYRDFAYRLERGRSYVRSGSVIDLRIESGKVVARVSGSSIYDVSIEIDRVAGAAWRAIQRDCAGGIASRLDLLAGRLSEPVMARLCAERTGLFPPPSAIRFSCSCPDWAAMCKHVAAVMYGIGARFDTAPELLFMLRGVSADELHAAALTEVPEAPRSSRVLAADGLANLFGIELADATTAPVPVPVPAPARAKATRKAPPARAARPKRSAQAARPVAASARPRASSKPSKRARTQPSRR